ncbi:MAG: RNase adapter protein RapZ [Solirubrobacteraceae bacterium]|nr:RNase adapter protein RapZ [Solirubrobacteraceae bacterium]
MSDVRRATRDPRVVQESYGRPGTSNLDELVIISGLSGAGKSSALNVFEDAGYFCVDNLPAEMIRTLADLFMHEGSKVERAAVVSDSRGGEYLSALAGVIDELDAVGLAHRVVFLTADEQTLLNRYKETRRRHPLAPEGSVAAGIAAERALLAPFREHADVVIDTTGMSAAMLRGKIIETFLGQASSAKLAVTFASFGFKHGPPRDADLLFDVRFLPNPYYETALRPLTGLDRPVVDFIDREGKLAEFYALLEPLLDYLLGEYVAEGKSYLVVAIGCTGGRHRSVAIAEHLAERYARRQDVLVAVTHRDVEKAAPEQ